MGTGYHTQSQGYGNTASLSYPDTWVRKPDCLHLPYNPPLLGSSPYSLHEDVFRKGPSAKRAEPCTHNPQQQYRLHSLQQQASKTQALPQQQHKLQQHTAKTQVIRSPLGTGGQSNSHTSKATHVSHPPRGAQWELQPTHHSSPPSNVQENESDTDLSESSPPGLVLGVLSAKECWSSQIHSLSCEPPRAILYGIVTSQPGLVTLLFGPSTDVSPGSIPQGCLLFHWF